MRFPVPLAPLVVLAAVASVNACGKQQEAARPPQQVLLAEAPPRPAAPVLAAAPEPKPEPEPAPTPEEVKEFQRPVQK